VLGLTFGPDGDRLWVSCEDQMVRIVALEAAFAVRVLDLKLTPGPLLLSADGRSVYVAAMWSGKTYRYDARGLDLLAAHPARHANMLVALLRQPGGRLALSASRDGVVGVFDADRDVMISVIHATTGTLVAARFSPDGARILTATADGEVRIWPLDPLAVALRHRPRRLGTEIEGR
jgi:WD40 repeat protein